MRKLIADFLFTHTSTPIANGMLVVDAKGTILKICAPDHPEYSTEGAEYVPGWIVPGFVNSHCHLELSHLKGQIPEHIGLNTFVNTLMGIRKQDEASRLEAIREADRMMHNEGIVAVADICNGALSFETKAASSIRYYSLLERLGFLPSVAKNTIDEGLKLKKTLNENFNLEGNLCLHAPYSASEALQSEIAQLINDQGGIYSIHHQESAAENELFASGTGEMANRLRSWKLFESEFPFTGIRPIEYLLPHLPENAPILLVHNTFTAKRDLDLLTKILDRVYFCLCPLANQYIENRLPNIDLLRNSGAKLTIGTDSLASNHQLSMVEELKCIQEAYPHIPLEEMLKWSSLHGAQLLGLSHQLGSLRENTQPGLVHIYPVDNTQIKLTAGSRASLL